MIINNRNLRFIIGIPVAVLFFVFSCKGLKLVSTKFYNFLKFLRVVIWYAVPHIPVESQYLGYFPLVIFGKFKRELVLIIIKFKGGCLLEGKLLVVP